MGVRKAARERSNFMRRAHRNFLLAALAFVLAVLAAGCGGGGSISENYELSGPQGSVRLAVGSKNFTEQEILGHITLLALKAANAEVIDRTGLGGTERVRQALISDNIDMYWEYTGTGWLVHLAKPEPISDSQEQYQAVAEQDLEQNNVEWLEPAPANNTYAIAVREGAYGEVQNISDLGRLIEERPDDATLCVGPEFSERADGLPGLEENYGFEFPEDSVFVISAGTVYGAVANGEKCNFGSVFRTNGRVPELGLRLLEDDEDFFAVYNPSLNIREETLDQYPELAEIFAPISEELDTETLRELSAAVEVEGDPPANVAERWLQENGFISGTAGN
ncbi:glycine betaine ABC transporter substrate-binding protein [soil metagenome]